MKKDIRKIDLTEVVASPILSGRTTNYMWTGVVKSKNITQHIVSDDEQRAQFVRLIKEFETSIKICRSPNVLSSKSKTFEEIQKQEDTIKELGKKIKTWLNNPSEHSIDKDVFWVELCREYEEIMENDPNEFKVMRKDAKDNLRRFKNFLDNCTPTIRSKYVQEQNKYVSYKFLTREQERKYSSGKEKNSERLRMVLEAVAGKTNLNDNEQIETLKEIVAGISISDLITLFPDRSFADSEYVTALKNYFLRKEYTPEIIEEMTVEQLKDVAKVYYDNDTVDFHGRLIADSVIGNINYIDIERLLLLSMIRPVQAFKLMSPKVETDELDIDPLKELAEKESIEQVDTDKFIRKECTLESTIETTKRTEYIIKSILSTGLVSAKTKFFIESGEENEEYSLKTLEQLMQKYCDGIYLTDVVRLNLIYRAYISINEMSTWSDELIRRVELSDNDKIAISMINFENFKRFYRLGILNKDDIERMLGEIYVDEVEGILEEDPSSEDKRGNLLKHNSKSLLKNLYNSRIIDESDVMRYVEKGILTTRMLESLEEDKNEEELQIFYGKMRKNFNYEFLLGSYKKYIEKYLELISLQNGTPEDLKRIEEVRKSLNSLRDNKEKIRRKFNKYHSNMSESEKHEVGENLLEIYYVDMDVTDEIILQETVKTLYEDGMIDLENIIHLDKKYVIPMLDKLSIKDARKIRDDLNDEELEELLDNIFEDQNFTDERRFIIVMNLLGRNSEYDKMLREYYRSLLDFDQGSERKAKPSGQKRKKSNENSKESKKYIYSDSIKWEFFNTLDKDVRVSRYDNGFVEFASSKLGVRIIEKYYEGNTPAYGTATYILSEKDYRANEGDLVTITSKGKILESATLREITPRKDRIAHRTQSNDKTWMDDIVRYFGIDYERINDSRYTEQELKELKQFVKENKKIYEEIIK